METITEGRVSETITGIGHPDRKEKRGAGQGLHDLSCLLMRLRVSESPKEDAQECFIVLLCSQGLHTQIGILLFKSGKVVLIIFSSSILPEDADSIYSHRHSQST
jgi:hypothetical protein